MIRSASSKSTSRQRLTALEATDTSVSVLTVNGRVVEKRFESAWPSEVKWRTDPTSAGEWLGRELKACGITSGNCTLIVPRREVTTRLLEVPRVTDDELVALVHLQAESRLGSRVVDVAIDFVPLADRGGDDLQVLLLTMSLDCLAKLQQLAASAGLYPVSAVAADLALPTLDGENSGCTLHVLRQQSQAELVLSNSGRCVTSMTLTLPDVSSETAQRIAASVERLRASLSESLALARPQHVKLYGAGQNDELAREITRSLQCPALNANPLGLREANEIRAVAASACLGSPACHDFLKPRQPVNHSIETRRRLIRWAAVAAAMVGLFTAWLYEENRTASDRIVQLRQQERQMSELIERGQTVIQVRSFLADWQDGSVNWTSQLIDFSQHLPETDRAYLTRLHFDFDTGTSTPIIRASGLAREEKDVMQLSERLLQVGDRYELQPHGIEPNLQDQFYKSTFQIEARVQQPAS